MKTFNPAKPDGENETLTIALPDSGTPTLGNTYQVPARCGIAVKMTAGQSIKITNPSGHQVCDFWAFYQHDLNEYLSMEHLRTSLGKIIPVPGDAIVSNMRRPLLTFLVDSSPGIHDTLIAACDHQRYQQLGCNDYHDNCTDNLRMALLAIGCQAPAIPSPFNLWMNVPVDASGNTSFEAPLCSAGDYVVFKAEYDVIIVLSACPQDITPVNGANCQPAPVDFMIFIDD
ncbi:DUF1989 domain-containing protein [Pelagibaculum spongiae]|uniref:Aminomethyltransferase n=1 Tax=Pelagibaculum spongiae TaxID=2080658 RepID=A0A2V1GUY4_9GAMM|nr:urea carboxylase-associated family protein [Pelagibaculum spongiae]PVZ70158.1 aminomethyltransferase [Pelagibaculum spongiae]